MNKARLLKLADALEKDANNPKGVKFDLGAWGYNAAPDAPRLTDDPWEDDGLGGFESKKEVTVSCGTAACAVGYAAISGIFRDFGFYLDGGTIVPKYGRHRGWDAVITFFDIDYQTSEDLFSSDSYSVDTGKRAELAVVRRIRKYVEEA